MDLLLANYQVKKKAEAILFPLASCFPAVIWGLIRQIHLITQLGVIKVAVEAPGEGKLQAQGRAAYMSHFTLIPWKTVQIIP